MTTISILSLNDLPSLKRLYAEGFETTPGDDICMAEVFHRIENNPDYIILCAKEADELIGSVMGVVCYELFGKCVPFMVVENVVVLSNYRRRGIARQLMQKLEELAKARQCSTILFVSSHHRTGAHKLYESLGYGADKVNGYRKRLA